MRAFDYPRVNPFMHANNARLPLYTRYAIIRNPNIGLRLRVLLCRNR